MTSIEDDLTHRECEVLLAYGMADKVEQVAEKLNITKQTAKNHLYKINQRLGTTNARQAIVQHYILNRGTGNNCHIHREDSK